MKQSCGVIVSLDSNGQALIHPGLLRKDDEAAIRAAHEGRTDSAASHDQPEGTREPEAAYSAALMQSLTTVKTAAIAAELARQPRIALATIVYTMILQEFSFELESYKWHSSLQLSMTHTDLREAEDSTPGKVLSEMRQSLRAQLPAGAELWKWCLGRSEETLLSFLAFVTAKSVNAIQIKGQSDHALRLAHANALAQSLNTNMNCWFVPTAENFFNRISKPQIADALAAVGKPANTAKLNLKKAQLAAAAESEVAGTGWLPEPRSHPGGDHRMTIKAQTSEGPPSLVFFRSAEEERRIFFLLCDYLSRRAPPRIRRLISLELQNLAGDDREPAICAYSQPPQ